MVLLYSSHESCGPKLLAVLLRIGLRICMTAWTTAGETPVLRPSALTPPPSADSPTHAKTLPNCALPIFGKSQVLRGLPKHARGRGPRLPPVRPPSPHASSQLGLAWESLWGLGLSD